MDNRISVLQAKVQSLVERVNRRVPQLRAEDAFGVVADSPTQKEQRARDSPEAARSERAVGAVDLTGPMIGHLDEVGPVPSDVVVATTLVVSACNRCDPGA